MVVDYLFPIFCLGCGEEGSWVCSACLACLHAPGVFFCPLCHEATLGGSLCESCTGRSSLSCVLAVAPYSSKDLLSRAISIVKYEFAHTARMVFDAGVHLFFREFKNVPPTADVIVPVPLHPRRFAERGFNQAVFVAQALENCTGMPVLHDALRRHRYTKQQTRLKKEKRNQNTQGAFSVFKNAGFVGKRVYLVDDVYTTGATMQEAAHMLRSAGAAEVFAFVLARG